MNIFPYSSHPLPCFDYCLSLVEAYSFGGTFIVTLHHNGLGLHWMLPESSTSTLQSMQQTDRNNFKYLALYMSFHPSSYLAVAAHLYGCDSFSSVWDGSPSGWSGSGCSLWDAAALFLHFIRAGCSMLIVALHVILAALSPPLMLQLSRAMIPAVSYFWCGKAVTLFALI